MNPESENFEALRKLMALKKYEQPPPGYFPRLSGAIITRIERGEGQLSLWQKITGAFVARPGLAFALGMAACGVAALDVVWMKTQPKEVAPAENLANTWETVPPTVLSDGAPYDPAQPYHVASWLGNTNPDVTADLPSLFAPLTPPAAVQAEFVPAH